MRTKALLIALLGINFLILLLQINGLSIGYHEAKVLYGETTPLQIYIATSLHLFGENDYALRIPMIILHLISVLLLFGISKHYLKREMDRLWIVLIYVLLPGVTSAALVVDNAGLMITALFLFLFLYLNYGRYALVFVPVLIVLDPSFAYLFFALTLFGIYRRDAWYGGIGIVALAVSLYFYGIDVGGSPESRFLDALGVYAAVFSPIVFLYLFYVLYRRMMAKEWDLIWFIAVCTFLISLLLSFRQRVEIQTFAPFLLLALPLAGETFLHTYRIRLREFRRRYQLLFYSAFVLLIFNALAVFFNHYFYHFIKNPERHFSYSMHVVKELSKELKKNGIECVDADNKKLQLRLRFYGITHCAENHFSEHPTVKGTKVTISYINKPIYEVYVTKIHK